MAKAFAVQPTVSAADATLKSKAGYIHWITISNTHATEAAEVELADGATDRWAAVVEAIDFKLLPFHANFDPPIRCDTSIIIDITNGTVKAVVGWS
ncbi:hypothetical protein LCGC14_0821500 [marine sediment metagenome]|uniref:Uncharacterized protein n=1 Tax=marine sediment metagenome TaxID=412755 RepID=A0A0F9PIM2_9ZZZZ